MIYDLIAIAGGIIIVEELMVEVRVSSFVGFVVKKEA